MVKKSQNLVNIVCEQPLGKFLVYFNKLIIFSFFFKVSWFNKWIKCTTEKASIYSFSHKNVERKCDGCCSADPSPAECSHTGLFIEKPLGDVPQSCDGKGTKGSECFGEPDPQFKSYECS